jgi:hypothetical protein
MMICSNGVFVPVGFSIQDFQMLYPFLKTYGIERKESLIVVISLGKKI